MEAKWKPALKKWSQITTCRHCWHVHAENCDETGCTRNGVRGYFTVQEMPSGIPDGDAVSDETVNA